MKYDNDYLKTLYNAHTLEEFLELVNPEDISQPRTRAILSALKRSIQVLDLEFNPLVITGPSENKEENNQPQQP